MNIYFNTRTKPKRAIKLLRTSKFITKFDLIEIRDKPLILYDLELYTYDLTYAIAQNYYPITAGILAAILSILIHPFFIPVGYVFGYWFEHREMVIDEQRVEYFNSSVLEF